MTFLVSLSLKYLLGNFSFSQNVKLLGLKIADRKGIFRRNLRCHPAANLLLNIFNTNNPK